MKFPRWLRWRSNSELEEEFQAHLELETQANLDRGLSPREARFAARRTIGNVTLLAENARAADPFGRLQGVLQDFRYGIRNMLRSPGFTAVAVLSLALGIGANTAVFSLLNRVVFRPLPVIHPAQVLALNAVNGKEVVPAFSYPNYKDLRDRNRTLSGLVAYRIAPMAMSRGSSGGRLWGYLVSGNYFDVLGVKAAIGHTITAADDVHVGAHPVMVLSYQCWQARFGGDPNIAGQTVRLNGMNFTVLGVTPREFRGTELFYAPEAYVPIAMAHVIEPGSAWIDSRRSGNLFLAARLRPDVTPQRAEAELNTLAAELGREYPTDDEGMRVSLSPPGLAGAYLRGSVIGFTGVLLAVTGLVLLIACTNLAGLLLARASDRRKEIGIRLALGAGRMRLIRQMLLESLILAGAGAAAGLLLAWWLTGLLAGWRPPVDLPLDLSSGIDIRVLLFTCAVTVATAILFGLMPAMQATRTDLQSALKNTIGNRTARRWPLRDTIVALQVTLSVVLLAGSVLVLHSLQNALTVHLGFEPHGAALVSFDLALQGYDEPRAREFHRRLLDRVRNLPGIEAAALADRISLGLDFSRNGVVIDGQPLPKAADVPTVYSYDASPGLFRVMRTKLLAGREFEDRDRPGVSRAAIVNQAFVDRFLPREQPLGRRFRYGLGGKEWRTIVGVVETGKYFSLSESHEPAVWDSLDQDYSPQITLVARSPLPDEETLRLIRRAVLDLDPGISFYQAGTLTDHLRLPLFPARMAASVLASFGIIAMLLAAVGIYGLMSYHVTRRAREFGIRAALGARPADLVNTALKRAALLLGCGVVAGVTSAALIGPLYSAILYNINPRDPMLLGLAAVLMIAIGLSACAAPARRAVRIDPSVALRSE
jgi:predicted permease